MAPALGRCAWAVKQIEASPYAMFFRGLGFRSFFQVPGWSSYLDDDCVTRKLSRPPSWFWSVFITGTKADEVSPVAGQAVQ